MIELTCQQIADAKRNDLRAVTAVIQATDRHVMTLARKYARAQGAPDRELTQELAQIGRTALWDALGRFQGDTVPSFITFIHRTLNGTLSAARKRETRHGISRSAAQDFEYALRHSGGDPYEAERVATDADVMGARRMSRDMAHAARLSWQGPGSLDHLITLDDGERIPFGETVADSAPGPEEIITADPRDLPDLRRKALRTRVHDVLAQLGDQQRAVLKATFGIAPYDCFGTDNDELMAAHLGIPPERIRSIRTRAKRRFRHLWLSGFEEGTPPGESACDKA